MPSEREFLPIKRTTDYQIAGNAFRAYYDAQDKLAFVVDSSVDEHKPNVLLVLNAVGNRKWDDILANDMGVDLETVRPRKDNKYQNLDIEYTGLAVYDKLINAYENESDLTDALAEMEMFRVASARRAAKMRLAAAESVVEKSRDTIDAASETIVDLQERVRELRGKLSTQRKSIGREPTKQSAAKILRTEAQIDTTNEKLSRAKKRLSNAQKRLDDALSDADVARDILAHLDNSVVETPAVENYAVATPAMTDVSVVVPAGVPAEMADDKVPDVVQPRVTDLTVTNEEQGALTMADEKDEVKPLFDKEPEILDEEIAFKPIEFGAPVTPMPERTVDETVAESAPATGDVSFEPIPTPLSFAPPAAPVVEEAPRPIEVRPVVEDVQPVLDTITPMTEQPVVAVPVVEPVVAPVEFTPTVHPTSPVAPAPVDSGMRPVSPITGAPVAAAGTTVGGAKKPTLLYYVMLIILIALSIFTLWLYQKNSSDGTPNLSATTPVVEEEVVVAAPEQPIVVEAAAPVVVEPEPEPVVMPEPEPVPVVVPEVEPEPVVVETSDVVPEPVVVEVQPEPEVVPVVQDESPFLDTVTEEEIIARKPAYNVSQNENMFVAASDYDTGDSAEVVEAPAPVVVDKPVVEYNEPAVVAAPVAESVAAPVEYNNASTYLATYNDAPDTGFVPQEAASQVFAVETEEVETCADGNAPDINGCCAGEIFTDMEDGTYACCTGGGIECFPPMN